MTPFFESIQHYLFLVLVICVIKNVNIVHRGVR